MKRSRILFIVCLVCCVSIVLVNCEKHNLNNNEDGSLINENTDVRLLSDKQLREAIKSDLTFEFPEEVKLTDGRMIKGHEICGTIFTGSYSNRENEKKENFKDLPFTNKIEKGKCVISVKGLFKEAPVNEPPYNKAHAWVAMRLKLYNGFESEENFIGQYDTFCVVQQQLDGTFKKLSTIIKGPTVKLTNKDNELRAIVSFVTDESVMAGIDMEWESKTKGQCSSTYSYSSEVTDHKHTLYELEPDTEYTYRVVIGLNEWFDVEENEGYIEWAYNTIDFSFRTPKE